MRRIAFVLTGLLAAFPCYATIIHVPADYPTIQAGINASVNGDTVLVQPGTYVENVNFGGHNITLGSLFLINGDTSYIETTIIDGDSSGSTVIFENGEDSTAVITGFKIQNGHSQNGGGIFCSSSSPMIVNNLIASNIAGEPYTGGRGGAIYCHSSSPSIISNTIADNRALGQSPPYGSLGSGGAIYCDDSCEALIANNMIIRNAVAGDGGGIYCGDFAYPAINNNTFIGNYAYGGGAIDCGDSSAPRIIANRFDDNFAISGGAISCRGNSECYIAQNVIIRNDAGYNGGGVEVNGSHPTLINNIIFANSSECGAGIYCSNSNPVVTNSIIWANTAQEGANIYIRSGAPVIEYCDVQERWDGVGNITANPLLVDPYNGDFNICAQSPCINAGDPDISDPDGSRSDIGLYFPQHPECSLGNVLHVSTTGNDTTGDGSSQNPFKTIQHAVNVSFYHDTVLVQNGIYVENVNFYGKNIVLASNFIYSLDTLVIQNTVIDGDSAFTVLYLVGCDSTAAVIGLTIRNGYGFSGGGINCRSSDPIIEHNIIVGNYATEGAGINLLNSRPLIKDNIIIDNSSIWYGGGLYCWNNSNASIIDNQITGNNALFNGGGIFCGEHSCPIIKNNIISNNRLRGYTIYHGGGGIYCINSSPLITQNAIIGNVGNQNGGGIYCYDNSAPIIINNTINGNSANSAAGGIYFFGSDAYVSNTILWGDWPSEISIYYSGSPEFNYCDIQGGWPGLNNIDSDPLFRDPASGDFHLSSMACGDSIDSPCIDAGDPNILDSLLDCSWGLGTSRSDMGTFGGGDSAVVGIGDEHLSVPEEFTLAQNHPNPFNSTTTIQYDIPKSSDVTLEIFDLLGRKIGTLEDTKKEAGHHQIIWNAENVSSGIYFYKIHAGDFTETKKMLLLK